MLQNIHILAGAAPKQTGNTERDIKRLLEFINRLTNALEYSFDLLDAMAEGNEKTIRELGEKIRRMEHEG